MQNAHNGARVFFMTDRELYDAAAAAGEMSYSPYSGVRVGAALLTRSGRVFTGTNVENASYGASICAERSAAVWAVSEGERAFVKIAVHGSAPLTSPCGICRQFLSEFSPDMTVIYKNERGELESQPLSCLLPRAFVIGSGD